MSQRCRKLEYHRIKIERLPDVLKRFSDIIASSLELALVVPDCTIDVKMLQSRIS